MNFHFLEILGPNKDLTNIDTEIKEAEEFLSEDQINIIRSIVTTDETIAVTDGATSSSKCSSNDKVEPDNSKWENLRPTLRSLGLVRESLNEPASNSNLNVSTEDESDFDSLSDDDSDLNDDFEDDDDIDEEEDNEDHENDIDLESIQKRRKKFRQKLRNKKKKKLMLKQASENVSKTEKQDELQIISIESEPIVILEEVKPKSDTSIISLIKEDIKPSTNESNNQCSKRRSSASLSKHTELTDNNLEKKTGLFENHLLNYMGELR